jgi:two-component system cell cycle sensor histidine kinase/response regulator CckA
MPGGGTIRMAARNADLAWGGAGGLPAGRYVAMEVSDEGVGMPPEIIPRIFDPFFSTKQTGSGLGLATSYSIVKRHGGTILAESERGKGSRFTVYLPASSGEPAEEAEAPSEPRPGNGRILVMDDEAEVRSAISEMLASMGYEAVPAADGAEAAKALGAGMAEGRGFAAAFLDLTVPGGMGGKEAAGALRGLDPGLPLCVSSGYADDPIMANPRDHGFQASLPKPFTLADLRRALDRLLPG